MYLGDDMKKNDNYVVDLYHDELTKLEEKERKKIEKFKKKEERKKQREEKKLEKKEDKEFARRQKMSRVSKYNQENKIDSLIPNVYKKTIFITIFITLTYFLYSLMKRQIYVFNSILFTLMMIGFILTSTIQKKKERKIVSIITCILSILWMLLHL